MINLAQTQPSYLTQVKSACITGRDTLRKTVSDFACDMKIVGCATKVIGILRATGRIAPDACSAFLGKAKPFCDFGNFFVDLEGIVGEHSEEEDTKPKSNWAKLSSKCYTFMAVFDATSFAQDLGMPSIGLVEKLGSLKVLGNIVKFVDLFPVYDILFFFGLMSVVDEVRKCEEKNNKDQLFGLVRDQMQIKYRVLEQVQKEAQGKKFDVTQKDVLLMQKNLAAIKALYTKFKPEDFDETQRDEIVSLYNSYEAGTPQGPNDASWNKIVNLKNKDNEPITAEDTVKFYKFQAKRWTKLANEAKGDKVTGRLSIGVNVLTITSIALKTFGPMTGVALFASGSTFMLGFGVVTSTIGVIKAVSKHYHSVNAAHRAPKEAEKVNTSIITGSYKQMCSVEQVVAA